MNRTYADNWPRISRQARQQTHHRCCWCLWRKAVETHHARYHCIWRGDLRGLEVPGRDVFPLCDRCHGYLHRQQHYLEYRDNRKNRNTRLVIWQLQALYQVRRLPLEWIALLMIVLGVGVIALK